MKRKIYDKLLEWKRISGGKTAVMLDGARRVGKSYIAEEFARNEYDAYLLIDFAKVSSKVKRYFNEYLEDLDTFFMYLLSAYNVDLPKGKSVIIFDEVQRFPKAREAIKYLVADGRYHYIETGSLISIRKNVKNIVIPSEEWHLEMFPMDFEEFMWATGHPVTMPVIMKHFTELKPLGREMHESMMDIFRQYLVVGGMPQVVAAFAESHDLRQVDAIKRSIIALYRADIRKFAGALKDKVLSVFNSIPSQLSKHEKKFSLAEIDAKGRMRGYDSTFEWLESAMTVNLCRGANEPNVGLEMNCERMSLKCYLGDTGLLISMAFGESELMAEDIHNRILSDRIELNKGMLVENVVAQMFRAAGHALYFYSNSSRISSEDRMEIDFLVSKSNLTRRHNVSPVEVKSGRSYAYESLSKFRRKYSAFLDKAYVLHAKDVVLKDGVIHLPLYMAPLIVSGNRNA